MTPHLHASTRAVMRATRAAVAVATAYIYCPQDKHRCNDTGHVTAVFLCLCCVQPTLAPLAVGDLYGTAPLALICSGTCTLVHACIIIIAHCEGLHCVTTLAGSFRLLGRLRGSRRRRGGCSLLDDGHELAPSCRRNGLSQSLKHGRCSAHARDVKN
jgi:hypothetical protein